MLEPRPPRQIDDTIPKELERICLKAHLEAGVRPLQHGARHERGPAGLSGRVSRGLESGRTPRREARAVRSPIPSSGECGRFRRGQRFRAAAEDRSQGVAVLRPDRCRLLPETASRSPRPARASREHPLLEDPHRGDGPRAAVFAWESSTGRRAAASRRWSRPVCCRGWTRRSSRSTWRRRAAKRRSACCEISAGSCPI